MQQPRFPYALEVLRLTHLVQDPDTPLKSGFSTEELRHLLGSIREHGILQELAVWKMPEGGQYLIIDGHRRYRCARELKIEIIPCLVYELAGRGDVETLRYILHQFKPLSREDLECQRMRVQRLTGEPARRF